MSRSILNVDLIQQCKHRFRSLEVELNDAARNGAIPAVEYAKRINVLQQIGQKISVLEVAVSAAKMNSVGVSCIDLPLIEECSREEQAIIRDALSNSQKLVEQLTNDAEKLKECLLAATSEDGNWIKVAFRLSWIRTRMSWAEHQLNTTRSLRGMLESFISKVSPQKKGPASQADLVEAFREFETTTSRIANLRTKLQSDIAKNHDQEQWLRRYESNRKLASVPVAPPVPAEIEIAKNDISARFLEGSINASERLVIARKLADSLTNDRQTKAIAKQKTIEPVAAPKPKTKIYGKGARK